MAEVGVVDVRQQTSLGCPELDETEWQDPALDLTCQTEKLQRYEESFLVHCRPKPPNPQPRSFADGWASEAYTSSTTRTIASYPRQDARSNHPITPRRRHRTFALTSGHSTDLVVPELMPPCRLCNMKTGLRRRPDINSLASKTQSTKSMPHKIRICRICATLQSFYSDRTCKHTAHTLALSQHRDVVTCSTTFG